MREAADEVLEAYEAWIGRFREVTRRARVRFLAREWREGQNDAQERLDLYADAVEAVVTRLGDASIDAARARDRFATLVAGRQDAEIAETFYSSVMRRVLGIVGVDPAVEFTAAAEGSHQGDEPPLHHTVDGALDAELVAGLFRRTELAGAFAEPRCDAEA
ncbi:MAG TPA: isocitrate dehydrogenase kinase/phosphatase AceK regulatory subunit, partial [Longimicrobiaceae bacterium]|nr:isocitrate dehydrogenase kinase/phosphatase AceK regulatory subunit [Longimicrobiaceae bacterium]